MTEEMIPISPEDVLVFDCSPSNPCFNECCRNLNLFLTPYDILRLKNRLGMTSDAFLRQYTSVHAGPETGLPVVTFKPDPHAGYSCPFVTETGCSVYEDRPASCRMYPLARAVTRSRETGETTEHFALIQEAHCKGFGRGEERTVAEWLDTQDVKQHNEINDRLMEIISLKNTTLPGKLEGFQSDRFYLACYDLDSFRKEIFSGSLLDDPDIPSETLDTIEKDDTALLFFGLRYITHFLFGKSMDFKR